MRMRRAAADGEMQAAARCRWRLNGGAAEVPGAREGAAAFALLRGRGDAGGGEVG